MPNQETRALTDLWVETHRGDRAGPPTPRNEPWRQQPPPLPEQPGRLPVPARDARENAFREYCSPTIADDSRTMTIMSRAARRNAFVAGFGAGYRAAGGPVNHELDTGSLFPTMGLAHDC